MRNGLMTAKSRRALILTLFLALGGCSSLFTDTGISVRQTGQGEQSQAVPQGTDPDDAVIGRREHPRILANYGGVYSDRKAEIMLARIVGRLLAAADQPDAQFTVTILDTPDVNAFALPGGYIYVTRGILALANDASELAAVLAHEIAHVTLRHARARSSRVRTSAIVDQVITSVLGGNIETDQTAARSRVSLAAFSQAQELAADKEGIAIAARAGYQPQAAARFLTAMGRYARLVNGTEAQGDDFLGSHPSTPDRINKAIESAQAFAGDIEVDDGRKDYQAAIDGLQFGESPNQGAIADQQFIHSVIGFTFFVPSSYTLENSTGSVVGVASDGEAVRFDSAQVPSTMPLVDYLRSGWIAGLNPDTVHAHNHNGIDMASGEATTDQWTFRVTAVRFKSEVYRFIFAARESSPAFEKAAADTVASFREIQPRDLSRIRKTTIRLVKAKSGDTTQSLARKMSAVGNATELFLVLNNLYHGDMINVGDSYKIVRVE